MRVYTASKKTPKTSWRFHILFLFASINRNRRVFHSNSAPRDTLFYGRGFFCAAIPMTNWNSKISFLEQRTEKVTGILRHQTEIRVYLPFSDWFRIELTSVWFKINRKMINTIWFRFDDTRFGNGFSVWMHSEEINSILHPSVAIFGRHSKATLSNFEVLFSATSWWRDF